LLRKKPPDEAAKALAGILSENRSIKPNKQLLSRECGVSVGRINVALNGSRPRRPKPSPETLAALKELWQGVYNLAGDIKWRSAKYERERIIEFDRYLNKWMADHPDFQNWNALGPLPGLLTFATDALWVLVDKIAENDRLGYY
jgi:hypothetical protein